MEEKQVLDQLTNLVGQLGLEMRWEEGDFTGGICRVDAQEMFIINPSLPTFEKVQVLCLSLRGLDLSKVFVVPRLRALIEGNSAH